MFSEVRIDEDKMLCELEEHLDYQMDIHLKVPELREFGYHIARYYDDEQYGFELKDLLDGSAWSLIEGDHKRKFDLISDHAELKQGTFIVQIFGPIYAPDTFWFGEYVVTKDSKEPMKFPSLDFGLNFLRDDLFEGFLKDYRVTKVRSLEIDENDELYFSLNYIYGSSKTEMSQNYVE